MKLYAVFSKRGAPEKREARGNCLTRLTQYPPLVINKYPHKSASASFNLNLNYIALKRAESIKYIGILIDKI